MKVFSRKFDIQLLRLITGAIIKLSDGYNTMKPEAPQLHVFYIVFHAPLWMTSDYVIQGPI